MSSSYINKLIYDKLMHNNLLEKLKMLFVFYLMICLELLQIEFNNHSSEADIPQEKNKAGRMRDLDAKAAKLRRS